GAHALLQVNPSSILSGTVTIGGKLLGSSAPAYAFDLPSHGMTSQIIINAANGATGPFWTAPIRVDSLVLDDSASGDNQAPYYGVLSSTLGGGAIGVLPYSRHPKDSEPDQDATVCEMHHETWPNNPGDRETIVISHYGPVVKSFAGTDMPLKVERQSMMCQY